MTSDQWVVSSIAGRGLRRWALSCAAAAVTTGLLVPAARADYVYAGPDGGNWFDGANWTDTAPDPNTTGTFPPHGTLITINVNNGVAGTGPVFNPSLPAQDPSSVYNIARLYVSSNNSGPGSTDPEFAGQSLQPNKLTIQAGGLRVVNNYAIVGRHVNGTVVQNGGTFSVDQNIRLGDAAGVMGTYEYHGGTLDVGLGADRIRLGNAASSIGKFVVYNDGPAGAIKAGDFYVASSNSGTTTGIVEFHYGDGGVRPIQVVDELRLNNSASAGGYSSRLDLVLDEAPAVDDNGVPDDLALFKTGRLRGLSDATKYFYDETGTTIYNQGDIVSATFGGNLYQWAISYTGLITFSNADNSVVSGISAAGGEDVVLIGQPVPEPGGMALLGAGALAMLRRRRRRN